MYSFYLNTATRETSIVIYNKDTVIAEQRWEAKNNESERLQPAVASLLQSNNLHTQDIKRLIVCIGPGGFTSVRIGVSAANAWSFAQNIPLAAVSVFTLYPLDQLVFLSANTNETWLKTPGKDPLFFRKEELSLPSSFRFTGLLSEDWISYLTDQGGNWEERHESLPVPSSLDFSHRAAVPWYYKEPHITWSKKNAPR